MADFETVTVNTDLLILGGGMAACGAAVEASYWAKKNNLKVTMVDKAAMYRSGAVAMGLSAINQYVGLKDGENTMKDYCDYVRNDLMGVTREDLVASIARHVDSTVHLFEKWGLPIWKDEKGAYVHEGRWQLMINGESYKVVVAEAAKNALEQNGHEFFERIFITVRFKDAYGPVGAWFLLFKARATNALGENYMETRKGELENWAPYGKVKPVPANLRNYLMLLDVKEGKAPIYMRTEEAMAAIAEKYKDDKKLYAKKMKELESEAWEDFLDMTISQAHLWAATNVQPEEKPSEIAAAEPYFIGSHSGASGAWVSGPKDLAPPEYFWGYEHMGTVKGLFCAGDASGASSHKFSSASHAEGRIAAKSAVRYIVKEKPGLANVSDQTAQQYKDMVLKPLKLYEESQPKSTQANVNPGYIAPDQFRMRLQKLMDEYAGGVSSQFTTSGPLLQKGLELLNLLKEDSAFLGAKNLHELMRCWDNYHRMYQAEAHVRSVLFREETRWPGYYFRSDKPKMDDKNW